MSSRNHKRIKVTTLKDKLLPMSVVGAPVIITLGQIHPIAGQISAVLALAWIAVVALAHK